eukprot:2288364-Amphidinium_carterae.1
MSRGIRSTPLIDPLQASDPWNLSARTSGFESCLRDDSARCYTCVRTRTLSTHESQPVTHRVPTGRGCCQPTTDRTMKERLPDVWHCYPTE